MFPTNWITNDSVSSSEPECPWFGRHRESYTGAHLDREWIYMKESHGWLTRLVQRNILLTQHEATTYII